MDEGFLALVQKSITLIPSGTLIDNDKANPSIPSFKGNLHKICFAKKRLRASLKHWINKVGTLKCLPSHDAYLERVRADGYLAPDDVIQEETGDPAIINRHKLLKENARHDFSDVNEVDPETFLDVYHEGVLYLGVIVDENPILIPNANNPRESPSILTCSARLYRHVLWRRSFLDQLDCATAYGFVVTCGQGPSGDFLVVCKLEMTLPSSASIGSRVPVRVECKQASITNTESKSALDLLSDLGIFFLTPRGDVAKGTKALHNNNPLASSSLLYPGPAMLLPEGLRRRIQQEQVSNGETPRYKVMPTITGSLVIRCADLVALKDLVPVDFAVDLPVTNAWYVKCKTPILFGPCWDTSKLAINGTRKRLQLLLEQSKKHGLSERHVQVAKDWLFMHPLDGIHEPHRSVVVIRDMGHAFRGRLGWKDFAVAFESLLFDTLTLQNMVQLVHGDIHAGNVLLNDNKLNQEPPKLILVDWDEATREKPVHRNTPTEKEKRQYPAALINFPDLYTKYQLQELFEYYIAMYYSDQTDTWSNFQREQCDQKEEGFQAFVRHRHKMVCGFLSATSE